MHPKSFVSNFWGAVHALGFFCIRRVWHPCHTYAAFLLYFYCLIVGILRGYGRDAIPSYRSPPDQIPFAT